jgi:hypothetical protein
VVPLIIKDIALKAIAFFGDDPLSETGRAAAAIYLLRRSVRKSQLLIFQHKDRFMMYRIKISDRSRAKDQGTNRQLPEIASLDAH